MDIEYPSKDERISLDLGKIRKSMTQQRNSLDVDMDNTDMIGVLKDVNSHT